MDSPALLEPATDVTPTVAPTPPPGYDSDDDWRWMQEERQKTDLGAFALYAGLWVAVVNKQVVGAASPGPAALILAERVGERYGVPPEEVVVIGLPDPCAIEVG